MTSPSFGALMCLVATIVDPGRTTKSITAPRVSSLKAAHVSRSVSWTARTRQPSRHIRSSSPWVAAGLKAERALRVETVPVVVSAASPSSERRTWKTLDRPRTRRYWTAAMELVSSSGVQAIIMAIPARSISSTAYSDRKSADSVRRPALRAV